jgi:hypothetical protein
VYDKGFFISQELASSGIRSLAKIAVLQSKYVSDMETADKQLINQKEIKS